MKRSRKNVVVASLLAGLVWGVSQQSQSLAESETNVVPAEPSENGSDSSARFMLRSESVGTTDLGKEEVHASDFAWAAISRNSPADGSDPLVGAASGKPYYDFRDGNPHPYYIVPASVK